MTYTDFKQQAYRTCAIKPTLGENLAHMALGMTSEMEELDDAILADDTVNVGEELGDTTWYLALWETFRGIKVLDEYNLDAHYNLQGSLSYWISKLSGLAKSYFVYNKTIDKRQEAFILQNIMFRIYQLATSYNLSMEVVWDNIIKKLKSRFPEKFTEENAINRDTKTERKILEGK